MTRFLMSWILSGAALAAAAGLLGDHMNIGHASDTTQERLIALAIVALVFSLINTFVAPVVKTLSLPFIVITLGLFLLVINAAMLSLVAWMLDGLTVAGFWPALFGAIVISLTGWLASWFIGPRGRVEILRRPPDWR